MLDADLAQLYGVPTKTLNRAVQRNLTRFPGDFMFQISVEELEALRYQIGTSNVSPTSDLRSQSVTSKPGRGGRRYLPYAFTEHGAIMLASVLNSRLAINASIQVVRAFVQLRTIASFHLDLARKLEQIERKYDSQFKVVFQAIRELMEPVSPLEDKRIGFRSQHGGGCT